MLESIRNTGFLIVLFLNFFIHAEQSEKTTEELFNLTGQKVECLIDENRCIYNVRYFLEYYSEWKTIKQKDLKAIFISDSDLSTNFYNNADPFVSGTISISITSPQERINEILSQIPDKESKEANQRKNTEKAINKLVSKFSSKIKSILKQSCSWLTNTECLKALQSFSNALPRIDESTIAFSAIFFMDESHDMTDSGVLGINKNFEPLSMARIINNQFKLKSPENQFRLWQLQKIKEISDRIWTESKIYVTCINTEVLKNNNACLQKLSLYEHQTGTLRESSKSCLEGLFESKDEKIKSFVQTWASLKYPQDSNTINSFLTSAKGMCEANKL